MNKKLPSLFSGTFTSVQVWIQTDKLVIMFNIINLNMTENTDHLFRIIQNEEDIQKS